MYMQYGQAVLQNFNVYLQATRVTKSSSFTHKVRMSKGGNPPPLGSTPTNQETDEKIIKIQPLGLLIFVPFSLESPFGWRSDSYTLTKKIQFFPEGSNLTISFTATRISKFFGYVPVIGTFVGISRIYNGIQEYRHFNNTHLHSLSKRSVKWIARGCLETVPVLGGIVWIILDCAATVLNKTNPGSIPFEDATDCGFCHTCAGLCKCPSVQSE